MTLTVKSDGCYLELIGFGLIKQFSVMLERFPVFLGKQVLSNGYCLAQASGKLAPL